MQPVVIVGASDHAAVVLDVIDSLGDWEQVFAVLDASPRGDFVGRQIFGLVVSGTIDDLARPEYADSTVFPAVGKWQLRLSVSDMAERHSLPLATIVAPTASVSSRAEVDAGVFVGPTALIGPHARINRGAIINSGAIVEHHVVVGAMAHVGPGACIAGNSIVGQRATIGAGAVVRDEMRIGERAIVGAGAAVVSHVEDATVVAGVPARLMRVLDS